MKAQRITDDFPKQKMRDGAHVTASLIICALDYDLFILVPAFIVTHPYLPFQEDIQEMIQLTDHSVATRN